MGLLDDAIRQHLELKRRHGADPGEVARQEQEALGPARRGAAPPEDTDLANGDLADTDAGAVSLETLEEGQDADDRPAAPYDDDAPEDEYDDDDEEPAPSMPAGEPEAPVAPPVPPDEPEALADPDASSADAGEEDVLEETPEFLQETPEHDRLWFEQKPPRDFEF
jgi:hypothetical protein